MKYCSTKATQQSLQWNIYQIIRWRQRLGEEGKLNKEVNYANEAEDVTLNLSIFELLRNSSFLEEDEADLCVKACIYGFLYFTKRKPLKTQGKISQKTVARMVNMIKYTKSQVCRVYTAEETSNWQGCIHTS